MPTFLGRRCSRAAHIFVLASGPEDLGSSHGVGLGDYIGVLSLGTPSLSLMDAA